MGSDIYMESQLGKGTIFYFDLITEIEYGKKLDANEIQGIHRCLVVDDNDNNRLILTDMMAYWNIDCIGCSNGLEALKILEELENFEVIIVDYHMPYLDGLQTIKMMKEKLKLTPEKQPIILLHSSSDDEAMLKKCNELGITFRLTKPVKSDDLFNYLSSAHTCKSPRNVKEEVIAEPIVKIFDKYQKELVILIAEDVAMNMILAKALVHKILPTSNILEANNGKEAVQFYQQCQPDIILMDIQMPEMDGIEATLKIRELEKNTKNHTPIFALTAGILKEEKEKCIQAGIDDFLAKPIEFAKLQNLLQACYN